MGGWQALSGSFRPQIETTDDPDFTDLGCVAQPWRLTHRGRQPGMSNPFLFACNPCESVHPWSK